MAPQHRRMSRNALNTDSSDSASLLHPAPIEALAGNLIAPAAAVSIEPTVTDGLSGRKTGEARHPAALSGDAARKDIRTRSSSFADTLRCRVTWRLVAELFAAACERDLPEGVARRRPRCHMRQIAMYLSHVVLSVPYQGIATAFGRDRTTVVHACAVVEDRRDDAGYDHFVEQCERCVKAVFAPLEHDDAEL